MKVAIDAMGGDRGVAVTIPAGLEALQQHPDLTLSFYGPEDVVQTELRAQLLTHTFKSEAASLANRCEVVHASEVVAMGESPAQALRQKPQSSMRLAIEAVKQQAAAACVSAGNTGALMAMARHVLRTLPGVDRPAILSSMPSANGGTTRILDLGANVDCSAQHLFQFAIMAWVLAKTYQTTPPRVGLLNVGSELTKGSAVIKEAAKLIEGVSDLHYVGFVEGDDLFSGRVDVVVADGLVGNVALKTAEGLSTFLLQALRGAFSQDWTAKAIGVLARPFLKSALQRFDPERHNGASFLGLAGLVIKSHGGATANAFANAISVAVHEARERVHLKIADEVARYLAA